MGGIVTFLRVVDIGTFLFVVRIGGGAKQPKCACLDALTACGGRLV